MSTDQPAFVQSDDADRPGSDAELLAALDEFLEILDPRPQLPDLERLWQEIDRRISE